MKISIIVPIYNAGKFLDKCINSLITQSYKNIEIILVNDGSTDKSQNICEKYVEKYNFVFLVNQKNLGVSVARNVGIEFATSELLMFVDSDDYVSEDLCSRLIKGYRDEDLVFCNYIKFQEKEGIISFSKESNSINHITEIDFIHNLSGNAFSKVYHSLFFNTPVCKLYKKSKINNGFRSDLSLGEDLLFNLDYLSNCNKIKYVNSNLYFYRIGNTDTLSTEFKKDRIKMATYIYNESLNIFNDLFKDKYEKDIVSVKYLEEYAISLKKMLNTSSLSYKAKLYEINRYRIEYCLTEDLIKLIPNLEVKYRLFLLLYIKKMDRILFFITKIFNLLK